MAIVSMKSSDVLLDLIDKRLVQLYGTSERTTPLYLKKLIRQDLEAAGFKEKELKAAGLKDGD